MKETYELPGTCDILAWGSSLLSSSKLSFYLFVALFACKVKERTGWLSAESAESRKWPFCPVCVSPFRSRSRVHACPLCRSAAIKMRLKHGQTRSEHWWRHSTDSFRLTVLPCCTSGRYSLDAGQSHDEIPAGDPLPPPPLYSAKSRVMPT